MCNSMSLWSPPPLPVFIKMEDVNCTFLFCFVGCFSSSVISVCMRAFVHIFHITTCVKVNSSDTCELSTHIYGHCMLVWVSDIIHLRKRNLSLTICAQLKESLVVHHVWLQSLVNCPFDTNVMGLFVFVTRNVYASFRHLSIPNTGCSVTDGRC